VGSGDVRPVHERRPGRVRVPASGAGRALARAVRPAAARCVNNRPYHFEQRLDEHFVCHFALPGAHRPKADLIAEFAERLGTNQALCPPELFEPYREFLEFSEMGALLGIERAEAAPSKAPASSGRGPARRAARAVRSVFGR
jgi:hypothetical protein